MSRLHGGGSGHEQKGARSKHIGISAEAEKEKALRKKMTI